MKKTMQKVCGMVLLTVFLLIPAVAQDNAGAVKQAAESEKRYEAMGKRLNLSAEQKEKIQALRQNQREEMLKLHEALKEAQTKLKEHLDNPDDATRESIAPLAAEVKTLLAKMVDQRTEAIFAAREILTAEQFSQLQRGRQKMRDNIKDRRLFRSGNKRSAVKPAGNK